MSDDRGSVTIWMLGLVLILLGFGGLVLDLWRVLDAKHRVELIADTAAVAGAGMLDEGTYRRDGLVLLDEPRARQRARSVLPDGLDDVGIATSPGAITVVVEERVELSLLQLLLPSEEAVVVRGSARGSPVLRP
ncbi:MAG: Tad domain-containing protein [Acidimicrobiia bacterium]|nr:Tad domain-containing protein [Acidimicrobiia bacterium]